MAERFPDFIIGGAPKFVTTSGHLIFGQKPEIGLPGEEIAYFDVDDPISHSDSLRTHLSEKLHHLWFKRIKPLFLNAGRPPMREATRAHLQGHLSKRNDGLSEFLGRDLAAVWPGFNG